jgi:hypothetical protein
MAQEQVYAVKRIDFFGRGVSIVLQNANGPCPLLALGGARAGAAGEGDAPQRAGQGAKPKGSRQVWRRGVAPTLGSRACDVELRNSSGAEGERSPCARKPSLPARSPLAAPAPAPLHPGPPDAVPVPSAPPTPPHPTPPRPAPPRPPTPSLANVLSLRNQLKLPRDARDVGQERLVTMVADLLLDASRAYEAAAPSPGAAAHAAHAVSECLEVLSRLGVGIDVNVKFHSVVGPARRDCMSGVSEGRLCGTLLRHGQAL